MLEIICVCERLFSNDITHTPLMSGSAPPSLLDLMEEEELAMAVIFGELWSRGDWRNVNKRSVSAI